MTYSLIASALSMESEEYVEPSNETQSDLELEKACSEIEEADRSVERAAMEQEELEAVAETMESIQISLESAIADDEGLTAREAEAHRIALKHALRGALPMPVASLESFGDASERLEATQLSLESIGATIKKIWEAIKRAVMNAIRAIADFFAKLFGGVKRLREKAEKVVKDLEAKKKDGADLKDGELKDAPGLDRIHFKGDTNAVEINRGATTIKNQVLNSINSVVADATDLYKKMAAAIKDRKENDEAFDDLIMNTAKKVHEKQLSDKAFGNPLPGGKLMVTTQSKDTKGSASTLSSVVVRLTDTPRDKDPKVKDSKVDSIDTIIKIATFAAESLKEMEDRKKLRDDLKKAREEVVKETENLAKDAEGLAKKAEGFWTQTRISARLRMANIDYVSNIGRLDNYVFGWCRGAVSYCAFAEGKYTVAKP